MSEKYKNLIKQSFKRTKQLRLILKNGIRYYIAIENDKKPKYKKIKYFNTRKWIIKNVRLIEFKIIDKEEIAEIIKKDKKQQDSYDKLFQMTKDILYTLTLSNNQYQALTRFLVKNDITIGSHIAMTRKGVSFNTKLVFDMILKKNEK